MCKALRHDTSGPRGGAGGAGIGGVGGAKDGDPIEREDRIGSAPEAADVRGGPARRAMVARAIEALVSELRAGRSTTRDTMGALVDHIIGHIRAPGVAGAVQVGPTPELDAAE